MRWPAAVVVLPGDAAQALTRAWVYTAFSRGERHLSVVQGADEALPRAVAGDPVAGRARPGCGPCCAAAAAARLRPTARTGPGGSRTRGASGAGAPPAGGSPARPAGRAAVRRVPTRGPPTCRRRQRHGVRPLGSRRSRSSGRPRSSVVVELVVEDGADVEAADDPLRVGLVEGRAQPLPRLGGLVGRRTPRGWSRPPPARTPCAGRRSRRARTPRRARRARRARCCPPTPPAPSSASVDSGSRSATRCAWASSRCGSTTV